VSHTPPNVDPAIVADAEALKLVIDAILDVATPEDNGNKFITVPFVTASLPIPDVWQYCLHLYFEDGWNDIRRQILEVDASNSEYRLWFIV